MTGSERGGQASERSSDDGDAATIDVILVTPVRLYREGLEALLERDPGVEVVATADGVDGALDVLDDTPALVLFDAMTPEGDEGIRELRRVAPEVSVLALTVQDREQDMLALAEAGVHGFVTVDASVEELSEGIRSAARGEAICSPTLAAAFMRRIATLSRAQQPAAVARDAALTVREREILALVQEGLSNKQIAQRLRIQLSTAKNHVHSILGKLGVERRAEVVALGRERTSATRP